MLCKTTDSSVEFKIRSVGVFLNKMGERCEGWPLGAAATTTAQLAATTTQQKTKGEADPLK